MTDKERELLTQLIEKTRAGAIPWEPTAKENEFVGPYKGHATFTVSKYEDPDHYGDSYRLVMRDPENREMLVLERGAGWVEDDQRLAELYRAAHDCALNVEETIDAILDDLRKAG